MYIICLTSLLNTPSTRLGYTLAMVPILIKLSAINKLTRAGLNIKRAEIHHSFFKKVLASTILILLIYLTLWTVIDRPRQEKDYLVNGTNKITIISVHNGCASRSNLWEIGTLVFEAMLLVAITILTYQSRDVIDSLNESRYLAFMVYSHFLFLVMRIMTFALMLSTMITHALASRIVSSLLSLDTLFAICVYFCPKFLVVIFAPESNLEPPRGGHMKSKPVRKSDTFRIRRINGVNIPEGVPNLIRRPSTLPLTTYSVVDNPASVLKSGSASHNNTVDGKQNEMNQSKLSGIEESQHSFIGSTQHDNMASRTIMQDEISSLRHEIVLLKDQNNELESLLSNYSETRRLESKTTTENVEDVKDEEEAKTEIVKDVVTKSSYLGLG